MPVRTAVRALLLLALMTGPVLRAAGQLEVDFSVDVVSGTNPLTVQFSDLSTGPVPILWLWEFGDGSLSPVQNPTHTYTAPGSYTVKLTVFETLASSVSETKPDLIDVAPATLVTGFGLDQASGVLPLTVQFSDASTGPVDGWLWDFGDGASSSDQHPAHTYTTPGSYSVTLTPSAGGQVGTPLTQVDAVEVAPASLDTGFTISSTALADETLISLTRQQTGTTPDEVRWDLGDGAILFGETVDHLLVPQDAGGLDVSLTVRYFGQQETAVAADLLQSAPGPFGRLRRITSRGTRDLEPGDLDGDGDLDVVAILRLPSQGDIGTVEWFRNTGAGELVGPLPLPAPEGGYFSLVVEDLDGDGDLDILASTFEFCWYLAGQGNGFFAAAVSTLGPYRDLSAGDTDRDGDLDLAGANSASWLHLIGNSGSASFSVEDILGGGLSDKVDRVVCTDMDADGDADILSTSQQVGGRYWRNLDGLGADWQRWDLAGTESPGLAVADVELDGDLDLVLSGWTPATATWVPFENGLPGVAQAYPAVGTCSGGFDAADTDGDGVLELVRARVAQAPAAPIAPAALSSLDGSALAPVGVVSGLPAVHKLELADLTGDGLLDLLVGDLTHGAGWQPRTPLTRWTGDVGPGLAGSGGLEPRLFGYGALAPQELVTLALADALPGATTFLVLGATALAAPFKGGVLTPFPDLVLTLPVDANGQQVLNATWPGGVPAGVPAYAQHWVLDGGGPVGFAASPAVLGVSED